MAINLPNLMPIYQEGLAAIYASPMIGNDCTIYYNPKKSECPNCYVTAKGSTGKYKPGGPISFSIGNCPVCAGEGFFKEEVTEVIRLRVYWTQKEWNKLGTPNLKLADGDVMVLGMMENLPKLKQSKSIVLVNQQSGHNYRCELVGEPYPYGFGKIEFCAKLSRTV